MYILKIKFIFLSFFLGGCTFTVADKDFAFRDREFCGSHRWERDRAFHEQVLTGAQSYYRSGY